MLVLCALGMYAPSASAVFHIMKVNEVRPDNAGANDFLELKMLTDSQEQVGGHSITLYDSAGTLVRTYMMTGNVAVGQSQRTVLIGDTGVAGADFTDTGAAFNINEAGGAACFPEASPPDCVVWGSFITPAGFPDPQAAPISPFGVSSGMSINRSRAPNCATLDGSEDTDDSAADFFEATPSPQANAAVPVAGPTCTVLTVAVTGTGNVTAPGITCNGGLGPDCGQEYEPPNQVARLVAAPTGGMEFGGWTNCDAGPGVNPCFETMATNDTVTANFIAPANPELTVVFAGSGGGTVMGTGINCTDGTGDCSQAFTSGDPVSLMATPTSNSTFAGWTNCPSGAMSNPCTYNADLHRTITATFNSNAPTPGMSTPPPTATQPSGQRAAALKRCAKIKNKTKKKKCKKRARTLPV